MNIALVAHDNLKHELIDWALFNKGTLQKHVIYATGTTGKLLEEKGFGIHKLKSGPLGGDQQIGARIAEGKLDILFFFVDPMAAQPHEPDISALRRICDTYLIPIATNRQTADFIISSPLFAGYEHEMPDWSKYQNRKI